MGLRTSKAAATSRPDGEAAARGQERLDADEPRRTRRSVVAERSEPSHVVGSPSIRRVRARRRGRIDELLGYAVRPGSVLERIVGSAPFATLSLPVGDLAWYVHGEGPVPARRRVRVGAPLRWTRADRPDGPFDPLTPPAEVARVDVFRADADARLAALLGDPARPPAEVIEEREWSASAVEGRPWQRLSFSVQNALLLQALDPGLARYLGLMAPLEHLTPGRPIAWLTAGAFAAPAIGARVLARRTGRIPMPDDFDPVRPLRVLGGSMDAAGAATAGRRAGGAERRAARRAAAGPGRGLLSSVARRLHSWSCACPLRRPSWQRRG